MTVQELIDQLSKIEDKTKEMRLYNEDNWYISDVYEDDNYVVIE